MDHDNQTVRYTPLIRDMAEHDRPRERLIKIGAEALSTAELLAIILRTGGHGESVLRLAERLLAEFGHLPGLAQATIAEMTAAKGVGEAKAAEIKAALEVGRRLVASTPTERPPGTASSNGIGVPSGLRNRSGPAAAGAVSRPSMVVSLRAFASQ